LNEGPEAKGHRPSYSFIAQVTDLRKVESKQQFLAHNSINTTESCLVGRRVYTHGATNSVKGLKSPLDTLN